MVSRPGCLLPCFALLTLAGADERGGIYSVHLEADGYQPWDTAGVRVTEGDCHVSTGRFTAEMNPGS
jgi:hypothetical protein